MRLLYGVYEKTRLYLCALLYACIGTGFWWTMLVETRLQGGEDVDEGRVPCTIYAKGLLILVI